MKCLSSWVFCVNKVRYFLLFFLIVLNTALYAVTDWTMLIYVQANNNLSAFAEKNFVDMATVGSNKNLNILVEFHNQEHQGVWRYKIEKNKMVLDVNIPSNTDGNNSQDLVNSMQWAATKYPANKYFLVLWDHGIGILDPIWGHSRLQPNPFSVDQAMTVNNPRIQIEGITKSSDAIHRGILFNEYDKTYMTNYSLSQALYDIKTKVLKNKKIDIVGMDACLMAMVEVGYQIRNYAHYLVASEEVELAHGWNYATLLTQLSINNYTPAQAAQNIVHTYEAYYQNKIQFYTQSAINLDSIDQIKQGTDVVVALIKKYQSINKVAMFDAIKKARQASLQFSAINYIDLYSFFSELTKQVDILKAQDTRHSTILGDLKDAITLSNKYIEESVIANTSGKHLARAKGLSIYFPLHHIDYSYARTDFAHDSGWLGFIKECV